MPKNSAPSDQKQPTYTLNDFAPEIATELAHLYNTLALLKKTANLNASEAEVYVRTKIYLEDKVNKLYESEVVRLTAEKKVVAKKTIKKEEESTE